MRADKADEQEDEEKSDGGEEEETFIGGKLDVDIHSVGSAGVMCCIG